MLKEYLKNKKISIYKLSELTDVPYTTLNELVNGKKKISDCKIKTIENIAKALNLTIEALLHILNNQNIVLSNSWDENKDKVYYFPKVVNNDNYPCNRIHPLKQKVINEIYLYIANLDYIDELIIFGSSVNISCTKKSDIDIAIKLKDNFFKREVQNELSEKIQELTNYNSDIIWLNTLDKSSRLYHNINTKGVKIYE